VSLLKPMFLLVLLSLFAACAGSPTRPQEADSVIQVANEDVVAGKLGVKVFAHRIEQVRCWTYATAGLSALGAPEVLLSLKQEAGEADGAFPRRLLGFFRIAYELAEQKRLVEGSAVMLSDKDAPLVPGSSFRAVLFTAPQRLKGIPIAAPYLTAILVTLEEAEAMKEYGLARILGRLGRSVRHFPTPPWADRRRASVVAANEKESILGGVRRLGVRSARVWEEGGTNDVGPGAFAEARVTSAQTRVVLELEPGAPSFLAPRLAKLPASAPFALLTMPDANGTAALVWQPGDVRSPSAITKERYVHSIGGNFVLFTPSTQKQGAGVVEDGFAVALHEAEFQGLKQALAEGKPLAVEPSGDLMGFSIRVLEAVHHDPISGMDFVSERGWRLYYPREPKAPKEGPVAADEITLLTPEPEVGRLIGAEALAQFGLAIEAALRELVAATKPMRGRDLLVDTTIYPGGGKNFRVAAHPAEDLDPFVLQLYEKLEKIPAPSIPEGSIRFQTKFRLWGGSGSE